MVWSENPGQVNGGKGYGVVNRLYCSAIIRGTDGVHPGSSCGCSQQLFPLTIGLILVIGGAAQYVIDGGPRLGRELCTGRYSFSYYSGFYRAGRLFDISSEVASPD